MSSSQPLAVEGRGGDEETLVGSCTARVLILIDIAELPSAAEKRANGAASGRGARASAAAGVVDGLRLSVLRVLTQLCLSCPANSWVEWAPRFFDSRPGGVGKTPAELRARLRSRQVPQGVGVGVGVRGFRKVTQASFSAFGDACLGMVCGVQGDPLARDRETALRRWAHGQKKHPPTSTCTQPRPSEPGASSGPCTADSEDSRDDVSRRMYDGHDMSSHEVVVRSLLEVLQEFDDASEGDRTAAPSIARGGNANGNEERKLQLLLLHSAFPRTDEDAEQFALRGNFTTEAATINRLELPETRATALDDLLNANLGKAVAWAGSRGVSFLWQEGGGHESNRNSNRNSNSVSDLGGSRDEASVGPNQRESSLQRCLSAAGGSGVLRWGRVGGCTGLLPPSAALGRQFGRRQAGERWHTPGLGESDVAVAERRKGVSLVGVGGGISVGVSVALNRQGDADVHLVASIVSGVAESTASDIPNISGSTSGSGERAGAALLPETVGTGTGTDAGTTSTPWRLMGTVPIDQVWPSCLEGQGWGATRILRAGGDGDGDGDCGRGAQLWRRFLGELVAEEMAGVMSLPQRLFGCDTRPMPNSDGAVWHAARLPEALAVALVVPIRDECAVCFSTTHLVATLPSESEQESGAGPRTTTTEGEGLSSVNVATDERGASTNVATRAELVFNSRGVEVGLAMQESSLARKRRRQAKSVPGKGARGMKFSGSSMAGVEDRRTGAGVASGSGSGGGLSGSLSPRDSGSLCFTGEGEGEGSSGDGAVCDVRQWRFEMETTSVTSNGSVKSASPRGYQLFNSASSTPGGAIVAEGERDDDQMSSTGSTPLALSGPRRALHQALEDVSSRSSLLGPDADSSSTCTPGNKEGTGWTAAALAAQRFDGDATASRRRGQKECVFPSVDDTGEEETDVSDVVDADVGASVLPLSLMSEPALACLPGPALPAELVALAERCSLSNHATAAAAAALSSEAENASGETDAVASKTHTASPPRVGARQRFIDSVRSSERTRQGASAAATPVIPAEDTGTAEEAVPAPVIRDVNIPEGPVREGREEDTQPVEPGELATGDVFSMGTLEGRGRLFEESVSKGVAGLQMQYREVVEGGQRSPVHFVVCAVPEAIRDMVDGGKSLYGSVGYPTDGDGDGDGDGDDRHVRVAQVLAAVVSGLTSTPKELSSRHRAKRNAGVSASASASASVSGAGAAESGAGASTSAAKPAVQKIRDYQLQALLLCQLNSLAMDLPEAPESLQAFLSLDASEVGDASGDGYDSKGKKGKGKGKRKKRKRKGKDTAPTRPSDPLPDCRRNRLVDYLQPISTMLDACTVTKPPPVDDGGGRGGGGTSADGDKTKGTGKGSQSRAYDGTLADFMGLALVEHFAERLPRTLAALFEDFECHPPDALTAALMGTGTPSSTKRSETGGTFAAESEAGGGPYKGAESGIGGALHVTAAEEALEAGSAPKSDVALSSSRGMGSTAGILLSDRTAMSHNHFKMSGVLNGYREVKLKGHTASGGGLRPSVLGKVSGNGRGERAAQGSGGSGESEGWRTSNWEGKGKSKAMSWRGARSRATRDSQRASASASGSRGPRTGQQSPSSKPARVPGIRQSPRLNRKRTSSDGDGDLDGDEEGVGVCVGVGVGAKRKKSVAESSRGRPLSEAEAASASPLSATATTVLKRRLAATAPCGGVPRARARARAGVLVGETPQKRSGGSGAIGIGMRSSGRHGGRASRTSVYEDQEQDQDDGTNRNAAVGGIASPASPATAGSASRKPSKRRPVDEARVAASPTLPMSLPSAGSKKRRRAVAAGLDSPVESLFVAESPGVSTGSVPRGGRSGWAAGADTDADGVGLSRQLMAEGASPVGFGRRRGDAVVPDTPA
eukprot:g5350.t1